MAQVSASARAALYARLSARFNTLLATVAPDYGVQPFTINFTDVPRSPNFFLGQLDPGELEETTVYKLPLMALYSVQSGNQTLNKPAFFSGVVRIGLDVWLSWRGGNAYQDFESLGDAVEDVMNTISNELANLGLVARMGLDRGPLKPAEQQNWVQLLRFSFLFEVIA